jgi:hypothetical protein
MASQLKHQYTCYKYRTVEEIIIVELEDSLLHYNDKSWLVILPQSSPSDTQATSSFMRTHLNIIWCLLEVAVFWVVVADSSIQAMMLEAASTSETWVNLWQTSRCYNPDDSHFYTRCLENLEFHIFLFSQVFAFSDSIIEYVRSDLHCFIWGYLTTSVVNTM